MKSVRCLPPACRRTGSGCRSIVSMARWMPNTKQEDLWAREAPRRSTLRGVNLPNGVIRRQAWGQRTIECGSMFLDWGMSAACRRGAWPASATPSPRSISIGTSSQTSPQGVARSKNRPVVADRRCSRRWSLAGHGRRRMGGRSQRAVVGVRRDSERARRRAGFTVRRAGLRADRTALRHAPARHTVVLRSTVLPGTLKRR